MSTTLYERLGAADGIAALVDDIVDAHLNNPVIRSRYEPLAEDPERFRQAKRHLRDFLGAGTGGPEQYEGRNMIETHRGMNVSAAEYMAAMDDIMNTLEAHEVDEQSRKDVLFIAYSIKGEIMHL
ncbi:group I truncated hemoglobin [Halofilum ochraceum]|uniref:group I truncated hemoglobin n=1 Tax=Halofilum ochraceum TaxID=1611323 RepID=UPI00082A08C4|nr:group 1 truncated hemoglobin [Halofilum ochraceum]